MLTRCLRHMMPANSSTRCHSVGHSGPCSSNSAATRASYSATSSHGRRWELRITRFFVEHGENHQRDGLGKWWRDGGSLYLLLFAFEMLLLAFSRHSLARQQAKTHPAIVGDVGFQNDHKVLAATRMPVFELNVHFDHRAKFSQQDRYGS